MTIAAINKIELTQLDAVRKPIDQASGMPNAAYRDPDIFAFERDTLMTQTWAALAFESELPKNSYAKPIDFMGLPLLITRNREGGINVFHNVCSHRGMPLVREEGNIVGVIRCSYHSWAYDLDGNLKGTPHIGGVGKHTAEGFTCEGHGLKSVRCATWMGVIMINLSGDAAPFEEHIQPVVERWEEFTGKGNFDLLTTGNSMELEVKANWKLAVENYCEAYHLPWVHPALNSYSPLDQHYNLVVNDYASGQGTYNYNLSDTAGTSLPQFPDWPQDKIRHAEYISLYPNLLLGIQADHAFALILQPLDEGRTLEKLQLSYVTGDAITEPYNACRAAVLQSWRVVFTEDIFAVEGMQEGRKSPAFSGGVFSPVLDGPTHHFHGWVADQYSNSLTSS